MNRFSVIMPTLNEAGHIIDLIEETEKHLKKFNQRYELIIVDDDSQDGTAEKIKNFLELYKKNNIKLIVRKKEKGLVSALNRGVAESSGEIVIWMDCDFSHPPRVILELIKKIDQGYDVVIASRYVVGGKDNRTGFVQIQKLLSYILFKLTAIITQTKICDVTSGFIAIKRKNLLDIGTLQGDYGEYFIDMVLKLGKNKNKMIEIPYICEERRSGESKTANSIFDLIKKGRKYIYIIFKSKFSLLKTLN